MPYIPQEDRAKFDIARRLLSEDVANVGELNYLISIIIAAYIRKNGFTYATMNNAIGALECAKLEIYRRIVVPHEESKQVCNGDVFY